MIAKVVASQPVIIDNVRAKDVIPELNEGKVILHAGPPVAYENMPDPMQGSCVGAVLFEEWADNEADARKLLESGEINLCHATMSMRWDRWAVLHPRTWQCLL